ncbi:Progesterone receptor membrane component 2 [Cichlidogyrus casuarinus]|uniref:Progesterone receptor membrane component 2 n=1 Tax=Cichlidogyrus casuarinus TaxID=1844966 RepID=A0ABD2QHQ0_9PLAT
MTGRAIRNWQKQKQLESVSLAGNLFDELHNHLFREILGFWSKFKEDYLIDSVFSTSINSSLNWLGTAGIVSKFANELEKRMDNFHKYQAKQPHSLLPAIPKHSMVTAISCTLSDGLCWKLWKCIPPKRSKPMLPKLLCRDFTIDELLEFDGSNAEGRVLVGVNAFVFDVTNDPDDIYGEYVDEPAVYDDLVDMTTEEMKNLREWERQFRKKYNCVGRLLAPGETHSVYAQDDCFENLNKSDTTTEEELKKRS